MLPAYSTLIRRLDTCPLQPQRHVGLKHNFTMEVGLGLCHCPCASVRDLRRTGEGTATGPFISPRETFPSIVAVLDAWSDLFINGVAVFVLSLTLGVSQAQRRTRWL